MQLTFDQLINPKQEIPEIKSGLPFDHEDIFVFVGKAFDLIPMNMCRTNGELGHTILECNLNDRRFVFSYCFPVSEKKFLYDVIDKLLAFSEGQQSALVHPALFILYYADRIIESVSPFLTACEVLYIDNPSDREKMFVMRCVESIKAIDEEVYTKLSKLLEERCNDDSIKK